MEKGINLIINCIHDVTFNVVNHMYKKGFRKIKSNIINNIVANTVVDIVTFDSKKS